MASTETRTGFRLPWSSDSSAEATSRETHPADEHDPGARPDDAEGLEAPAQADTGDPAAAAGIEEPDPPPVEAAATRRPSKFLADLTRAMRAAADSERQEMLGRFEADAKGFVESIHQRSATETTELRKHADEDILGVRDWSKAEIARIREETERRIADRRERLDQEIEAHAARVERAIERVRATVGAYEADMSRFFDDLMTEEDPSRFAALASSLPEPPVLDEAALIHADEPPAQARAPQAVAAPVEVPATAEPTEATGEPIETEPTEAIAEPIEAEPTEATAEPIEATAEPIEATAEPIEASTEPIEASAEPIEASTEPTESTAEAEPIEAIAEPAVEHAWPTDEDDPALDPRVSALGLTPDFDAAEAEAAAAIEGDETVDDGSGDEIPAMDDATIAARLAGLVPAAAEAAPDLVTTQLVVTGLFSVASIAGFKRQVARLPGVRSVGVSSGPDGEFVFTVGHGPEVDLRDAIPTLQGFGARVTGSSEGGLKVSARDPETAA